MRYTNPRLPYNVRILHCKRFPFVKTLKKSAMQELVTMYFSAFTASADGIAERCVTESLRYDGNQA